METVKRLYIAEAALRLEIEERLIFEYIAKSWIVPCESSPEELDYEDMARLSLIRQLQSEFGVNDEAIPIILHLLDQLHETQNQIRRRK